MAAAELITQAEHQDKVIRVLGIVSAVAAILTLIAVITVVPIIRSGNSTTSKVAQGNDLASCRSQARSVIDNANNALNQVRTEMDKTLLDTLNGALSGDLGKDPAALEEVAAASAKVRAQLDAAGNQYDAAVKTYADAIVQSVQNPAAFLATCHAQAPA